ncbi:MAG: hypothetical protein WD294_15400 [Phycisphaeraceae bacterium]
MFRRIADAWLMGFVLLGIGAATASAGPTATEDPDWRAVREHTRTHAEAYAELREGLGFDGQQEREAEALPVATVQPHYAVTHPWVQEPIAVAGWYVPPRVVHRVFHRRLIVIRPPLHPPIWRPAPPWRRPPIRPVPPPWLRPPPYVPPPLPPWLPPHRW